MHDTPDRNAAIDARQARLAQRLEAEGLDAFLTFDPQHRRYLAGFTGSAGHVLVTATGERVFISDPRYTERATREAHGFRVVETHTERGPDLWGALRTLATELRLRTLGVEAELVSVAWWELARERLPGIEVRSTRGWVEALRRRKDAVELDALRRAQAVTDEVFGHILGYLRAGRTEWDVAVELRHQIELRGARNYANVPIVASGIRSAEGHAYATHKEIERGDFVLLDFGAAVDGYYSDMTRTVVCGTATPRQQRIHALVERAVSDGIAAIRAGATTFEAKGAGRKILFDEGFGPYLRPGVGHGIGLQVHEAPFMRDDVPFEAHDVVTFEPGIYIPQWGGVRIEDAVVVSDAGCVPLPKSPRGLIEVDG